MTQQAGIVKGDALQKIGSAGFIVGALLLVIGNLLMPHAARPTTDLQEMLRPLGEHESYTEASSLLIMIGFWGIMIGAAGVYRSIATGGAAPAQIGFYLLLAGTTLQTVSLSMDVAAASAVARWLAASVESKEAAWSVVVALNAVGRGIIPMTWIVYWVAFTTLGIAMICSNVFPRLLGWSGVILSIPVIAVGVVHIFTVRTTTITLVFVVLALLTDLWALAVGVWFAHKAWRPTIRQSVTTPRHLAERFSKKEKKWKAPSHNQKAL